MSPSIQWGLLPSKAYFRLPSEGIVIACVHFKRLEVDSIGDEDEITTTSF